MINKDLWATLLNSLWRIVSGPLILVCIPVFLNPVEQGYWYTFISISALSVLADLGFSTIILQFAAHEFAFLEFDDNKYIIGDSNHLWKLASFFRFSVRWLTRVVCIAFPLIYFIGYHILDIKGSYVDWNLPWVIYVLMSGVFFYCCSIMSFFEGCKSVGLLQSIRFRIAVCQSIMTLIGLWGGFNIYALSFSVMIASSTAIVLIFYYFRKPIVQLWKMSNSECYNWWPEFSALIWRYAISWCSGYFIFQLFTPIAFYFFGPEFSGKVGISIAMWTAGFGVANTWITAIIPQINILIAEKKWLELDKLFNRSLYRSMLTLFVGGVGYFLIYFLLKDHVTFFSRVLDLHNMCILFVSWIMQLWINTVAIYLRSHKKEPMMKMSIVSAIYISITTFLLAKYLSSNYMFYGFITSYVYSIPVTYRLWKKQKQIHNNI